MHMFDVQYGTTLFIEALTWTDLTFSPEQLALANGKLATSALRPEPVQAIVAASAQRDDDHDEEETKVFLLVSLRLQGRDEAAAEDLPPPRELLGKIVARLFQDAHVESPLAFEQPWEVIGVKAVS